MPNWFTGADGKLLPGRAISVTATTVFALATATWLYLGQHDAIMAPTDLTVTATNRAAVTLTWTQPRTLQSAPPEYNLIRAWAPHRPACLVLGMKTDAGTVPRTCTLATDAGAAACTATDAGTHTPCNWELNSDAGVEPLPDGGMARLFNTDAMITHCFCNRGKADEKIPPGYPYSVFPCTVGAACTY